MESNDKEIVLTSSQAILISEYRLGKSSSSDSNCTICMNFLNKPCHSNSCCHLFCYKCLKRWSTNASTCPLCKKYFVHIYHTFNEQGVHEKYIVPQEITQQLPRITFQPSTKLSNRIISKLSIRKNLDMGMVHKSDLLDNPQPFNQNDNSVAPFLNAGMASRVRVYIENTWAEPLPDSSGHYRICTSVFYKNYPNETYKLHCFILRDILAVREALRIEGRTSTIRDTQIIPIIHLIMRLMSVFEMKEILMINSLRPFLAKHTVHYCHEIFNYANSTYDMTSYDCHVKYSHTKSIYTTTTSAIRYQNDLRSGIVQSISGPTPVLDNEEDKMSAMDVTVLGSETDGSNVKIIPNNPTETVTPSLMDQPSTSTGIRHSLDQPRPNNCYNLRSKRLVSPTVNESVHESQIAPNVRREIGHQDDSSDDEESTTNSQTQSHRKSRKIKKKKN